MFEQMPSVESLDTAPSENQLPVLTDSPAPETTAARISWWRRWLGLGRNARTDEVFGQRLLELDQALASYPDAAVNYVLRGEIYLELGQYALAAQDFQQGLTLATIELESNRWGLVAQTVQDRAQAGLAQLENLGFSDTH